MKSIIAHRGASVEVKENTLKAFKIACDLNVAIELDVHLSRDLIPIVHHDDTINNRLITTLRLAEIKKLAPDIPTLKEVFNLPLKKTLMIELKKTTISPQILVEQVIKQIKDSSLNCPILCGSFEIPILQVLKSDYPEYSLIHIIDDIDKLFDFDCQYLAVDEQLLDKKTVELVLKNNKILWSFTVDSKDKAEELFKWGVAGIITNNPRELLSISDESI